MYKDTNYQSLPKTISNEFNQDFSDKFSFFKSLLSSTEYAGRLAIVGNASVLIGISSGILLIKFNL